MIARISYYIFLFVAATLFLSLWSFYNGIRPFRIHSDITPQNYIVEYENIKIKTKDGVELDAWYIPAKIKTKKTIILLHGYGADKGNILPSRIYLHQYFNLLFLDFRYFGQSGGRYTTVGAKEINDLLAAVQYLRSKGMDKIGVWGSSMGGAVAIMTAPTSKYINAIVAESSFASLPKMVEEFYLIPGYRDVLGKLMRLWGWLFIGIDVNTVSPMESARKMNIPIMLIHSKDDSHISYENMELLEESLKDNKKTSIVIFEDAPHGWMDRKTQLKIKDFFEENL